MEYNEVRLRELIGQIGRADRDAEERAWRRWDSIQHPLRGLGRLEDDIAQIAALTGSEQIALKKRAVVVFCSDNGVTAEGVTQTDSSVTGTVAVSLAEGRTSVCRMAQTAETDVIPVDMGILDFPGAEGVLDRRIGNGTADIMLGPAMSRENAVRAILTGMELAGELKGQGYRLLAAGEMGIGNTTTSSACASVMLHMDPAEVTGKGAGLSEEGLRRKIEVIRTAVRVNDPELHLQESGNAGIRGTDGSAEDPVGILSRLGGYDLLGMCGLYLGGALQRIPVLIDGMASSVAALAAIRLCPDAGSALLASHVSAEPAGALLLDAVGKKPLIAADMHLGEGTGAVAAIPLLDMALAVYRESCTFEEGGVEAYRPL